MEGTFKCFKDICNRGADYCVAEKQRCYKCEDISFTCNSTTAHIPSQCTRFCVDFLLRQLSTEGDEVYKTLFIIFLILTLILMVSLVVSVVVFCLYVRGIRRNKITDVETPLLEKKPLSNQSHTEGDITHNFETKVNTEEEKTALKAVKQQVPLNDDHATEKANEKENIATLKAVKQQVPLNDDHATEKANEKENIATLKAVKHCQLKQQVLLNDSEKANEKETITPLKAVKNQVPVNDDHATEKVNENNSGHYSSSCSIVRQESINDQNVSPRTSRPISPNVTETQTLITSEAEIGGHRKHRKHTDTDKADECVRENIIHHNGFPAHCAANRTECRGGHDTADLHYKLSAVIPNEDKEGKNAERVFS